MFALICLICLCPFLVILLWSILFFNDDDDLEPLDKNYHLKK